MTGQPGAQAGDRGRREGTGTGRAGGVLDGEADPPAFTLTPVLAPVTPRDQAVSPHSSGSVDFLVGET